MTPIPEKLIQTAAEALHDIFGGKIGFCYHETDCPEVGQTYKRCVEDAHRVLAAAFAKLAECEEAVEIVAKRLQPIRYVKDADDPHYSYRLDLAAARELLAALAKWGQL